MKLRHLAAFVMLLAVGCASETATTPPADAGTSSSNSTTAVEAPPAETQLAQVSLDVTGMK